MRGSGSAWLGHGGMTLRRCAGSTRVSCCGHCAESPQTVSQLTGATGLSRPTVEALVDELVSQGWIAETGAPSAGRAPGRPARRLRFRSEAGHVVGVDIGLRKIVLVLARLDGEVVAREREHIAEELSGTERIELLRGRLRRFIADHGLRADAVWAIGIGVPGMVDDTGRIRSVIVPDWTDLDLARRLADDFPCRILVENDVNLAVLAEHWQGAATLADDVACVLVGRRISCGLMINGKLHRGRRGGAGELGILPQLGLDAAEKWLAWDGERLPGESETDALARAVRAGDSEARGVLDGYLAGVAPESPRSFSPWTPSSWSSPARSPRSVRHSGRCSRSSCGR